MMGVLWVQLCKIMGFGAIVAQVLKHLSLRAQQRRAVAELEPLAGELGLRYLPPRGTNGQGAIRGMYRGRSVSVDPDEDCSIVVRFEASPRVVLSTDPSEAPPPADMVGVQANDKQFQAFWRIRRAEPALAERLSASACADWLDEFRGVFERNIRSVSVTSESVAMVLQFGRLPFIPSDAIRALLPACVDLADRIEPGRAVSVADALAPEPGAVAGSGTPWTSSSGSSAAERDAAQFAPRTFGSALCALGLLALVCKLGLAWVMRGAKDVHGLGLLATWARYLGRDVYAAQSAFQLPPPMIPILGFSSWLAGTTGLEVEFWSRALASCADAGTLLLLYRMLRPRLAEPAARWSLLMLAAWPAAVVLSGHHGGGTAVMVFLVVLAVHWIERGRDWLAGGAFGLALCTTLAPLYVLPALVLARRAPRARLAFGCGSLLVLVASWLPWWPPEPAELLRQLTHRDGVYGQWGLSWYFSQALKPKDALHANFVATAPYLLFILGLVLSVVAARRWKPPPLLTIVGVLAAAVVAASPFFELSDLLAVAPLIACAAPLPGALFVLSSTALVAVVYAFWAGAGTWYALEVPAANGFRGHADYFQLLCCGVLLALVWSAWTQLRGVSVSGRRKVQAPFGGWRVWGVAAALVVVLPAAVQARADTSAKPPAPPEPVAEKLALEYVDLSSRLLQGGENDGGIDAARKAAALQPTNAVAWNNLAVGLSGKQRWDEAIAAAERAVALAPSFQLAKNNLAWALGKKRAPVRPPASTLTPPR